MIFRKLGPSLKVFKVITQEHGEHQGLEGLDGHAEGVCFNDLILSKLVFHLILSRSDCWFCPPIVTFWESQQFPKDCEGVVQAARRVRPLHRWLQQRRIVPDFRPAQSRASCSVTTHQKYSKVGIQSSAAPISR